MRDHHIKQSPLQGLEGTGGGLASRLASAAGPEGPLYIDDVFSTYLYEGTGSTQTITNGIDLAGKGGLVWIKLRNSTAWHDLNDTTRGAGYSLSTNANIAQMAAVSKGFQSFNSTGFTVKEDSYTTPNFNYSGNTYASWTFRKAPGFFDVVTYAGDGQNSQLVYHNLGSKPGMILIKRVDSASDWGIYFKDGANDSEVGVGYLNGSSAWTTSGIAFNSHSDYFRVYTSSFSFDANVNGATYVAYIFAQGGADASASVFGTNSDQSIIKCGTYTGDGTGSGNIIDVGFEPQWVLIKNVSGGGPSVLFDNMRGMFTNYPDAYFEANNNGAESSYNGIDLHSTGFEPRDAGSWQNANGVTYMYVAIRRPHKPPTAATEVFAMDTGGSSSTIPTYDSNFPVDFAISRIVASGDVPYLTSRLTGTGRLRSSADFTESTDADYTWDSNVGWGKNWYSDYQSWMFRRAPGFFDAVTYTGNGVQGRAISHNLEAVPELMFVKKRDTASADWIVYSASKGATYRAYLNTDAAFAISGSGTWNDTTPTSTQFEVGNNTLTNGGGAAFVSYLFATLSGVSKVGSYSGTGNNVDVDCGFANGARFVLIKRIDNSGDWYIYDTTRGIVSGNDPYLLINNNMGQVTNTDYIDPLNLGFTVTSSAPAALNASGGTYLFLAIA